MRNPRRIWIALVVGVGLVTAACAKHAPQTTLEPEGPVGRKIDSLFHLTFWIAAGVFVLVEFGIVYLVWRYRHRDDRPEPVQVHGNTRLEITWTVLPAVLLLFVAVPTFRTIFQLAETPKRPRDDAGCRFGCKSCSRRELLGVIGHHGRSPCPFSYDPTRYDARNYSSVSVFLPQEYQEMCQK